MAGEMQKFSKPGVVAAKVIVPIGVGAAAGWLLQDYLNTKPDEKVGEESMYRAIGTKDYKVPTAAVIGGAIALIPLFTKASGSTKLMAVEFGGAMAGVAAARGHVYKPAK